jgi:hypothetical protein
MTQLDRYPFTGHSALMGRVKRDWQETEEVLGFFKGNLIAARKEYRNFVLDGIKQGKRPELTGGGLLRSLGGWRAIAELRRGREEYYSDERILGSSSFVESVLKEAEALSGIETSQVQLPVLKIRIAEYMDIPPSALDHGSRRKEVSRARALICYVWTRYLGRSGRELARELAVSPQAVYSASARIEKEGGVEMDLLRKWCK